MSAPGVSLTRLDDSHEEAAVDVLTAAFDDDPLLHRVAALAPLSYADSAAALFRYACRVRTLLDWPLVGAWQGERLVGVGAFSLPGPPAYPAALFEAYRTLNTTLGADASDLLKEVAARADGLRPIDPHFQVGTLGVRPEARREGVGAALMAWLHQHADAHPTATGIWLETENPQNLSFYQRLGYEVTGQTELDGVMIWGLYRLRAPYASS